MEKFFKAQRLYLKKVEDCKRLQKQIEKLQAKLSYPSRMDCLVRPLARLLLLHMKEKGYNRYELLGPFGICSEVSIHFFKKGVKREGIYDVEDGVKAITFISGREEDLLIRDYSKDTGRFGTRSIAAANGMNHPSVPITKDTTLEVVLKYVQ